MNWSYREGSYGRNLKTCNGIYFVIDEAVKDGIAHSGVFSKDLTACRIEKPLPMIIPSATDDGLLHINVDIEVAHHTFTHRVFVNYDGSSFTTPTDERRENRQIQAGALEKESFVATQ